MVTTTDIAADVGLSPAAVSMILNHKGRFAPSTRERVLKRARDLGYRPNAVARATRTRRFNALAVVAITPDWKGPLDAGVIGGCLKEASGRGCNLIATATDEADLLDLDRRPAVLRERHCDALLMNYHLPPPPAIAQAVSGLGMPVMWLNVRLPGSCVHPDDEGGGRLAIERLLALGHRRIAFLDFFHVLGCDLALSHYSGSARRAGCVNACAAAGLDIRLLVPAVRGDVPSNHAFLRAALAAPDRPDAIVCYGPREALAAMMVAWDLGLAVPRDLSLVQFHDSPEVHQIPLDTLVLPFHEVGRQAAATALDAVDRAGSPLPAIVVPCEPVFGATSRTR